MNKKINNSIVAGGDVNGSQNVAGNNNNSNNNNKSLINIDYPSAIGGFIAGIITSVIGNWIWCFFN